MRPLAKPSKVAMMGVRDDEKAIPSPENASAEVAEAPRADQDIAIAIVGEQRQDVDPALEARVVRKIDWFLIPTMIFGYGLVYYDKVWRACLLSQGLLLTGKGDLGFCCVVWDDQRSTARRRRHLDQTSYEQYKSIELGHLSVLLWHVGGAIPHDVCTATIQHGPDIGSCGLLLGTGLHAHCCCD